MGINSHCIQFFLTLKTKVSLLLFRDLSQLRNTLIPNENLIILTTFSMPMTLGFWEFLQGRYNSLRRSVLLGNVGSNL
jgi:hypothetical protein